MKKIKKILSLMLALTLIMNMPTVSINAANEQLAVVSTGGAVTVAGSSQIDGDALVIGGGVNAKRWENAIVGTVYTSGDVEITGRDVITDIYEGNQDFSTKEFVDMIDASEFKGCDYKDGEKNLIVGWGQSEEKDNFTLTSNAYIHTLTISPTLNLNIQADKDEIRIIRVKQLNCYGSITIVGGGKVIFFIDSSFGGGTNGDINKGGDAGKLAIVADKSVTNFNLSVFKYLNANIFAQNANINVTNVTMKGNIYTGGNVSFTNYCRVEGLVYAPNSNTNMQGDCQLIGQMITKSLDMTGNCKIKYGPAAEIDQELSDKVMPKKVEEPEINEEVETSQITDPETGKDTNDDNNSNIPEDKKVSITAVVPKRMSIRLEDGTVLKNNDKYVMEKGGTVRFQMCTNNWDTDTYTDDGQGVAGTVVYTYTNNSVKDKNFLRVDTNTYFMAVRYHFKKGDYNKQTGIDNVLSTPLESLSVNLPLGSTITSYAYKNLKKIASADVFVETVEDKSLSYTDFYWEY